MKIGLFIPCYVDQFYPQVGIATLQLLEKLGLEVNYPLNQTCCGQPMANSGFEYKGENLIKMFEENFQKYQYVIGPSGSCVMHLKEQLSHVKSHLADGVFEICEFLTDILNVKELPSEFPYRVGVHSSCHGLRGLRLATPSELNENPSDKPGTLLKMIKGIQLVDLNRKDECCGFGGTFAVSEEAVSVKMGTDRIRDHELNGAEVITGTDMSCLMHLDGLLKRQKKNIRVMHITEILNGNNEVK